MCRLGFALLACGWLLAAAAGSTDSEVAARRATLRATAVRLQVPLPAHKGESEARVAQTCDLGTAHECFESLAGNVFLNVGSFFDARERSSSAHYMVKLFENETAGSMVLRGMGFYSMSSHGPDFNKYKAAGATVTSAADPVFPSRSALLRLHEVGIQAAPSDSETCVEFTGPGEIVLEPGDAAWLVLRFTDLPDSILGGVGWDADATDRDCDFMTNDGGEHWFRPDPVHGPFFDWGITAYTEPRAGRAAVEDPTWSLVKRQYR